MARASKAIVIEPHAVAQTRNRLLAKVERAPFSTCWFWMGSTNNNGYGMTSMGRGFGALSHRVSWALFRGPLAAGTHLLHSCDTPCCINPDHLRIGTHAENMKDMSARGRFKVPSLSGERHPLRKLSQSDIDEIRSSTNSSSVEAKRFGVAAAHIRGIRRGIFWSASHGNAS